MHALTSLEPLRESFSLRLARKVAVARFFTFSLLLHMIIVLLFGGVVLFKVMTPAPDFEAIGGQLVAEQPMPPYTPFDTPQPPTEEVQVTATTVSTSLDTIVSTGTSDFKINSLPAMSPGLDAAGKAIDLAKGMAGSASGKVGGTMMNFFNTKAQAQSVVMVMDVSSSMVGSPKSPKTYAQLEKEVAKVIHGLPENAFFGIVAFSREARSYHNRLVRASSEEKAKAVNWIKKMNPDVANDQRAEEDERQFHHGTRADLGLAEAFALQPDAIFFVSDGEPSGKTPPEILEQVTTAQKSRAKPLTLNVVAYVADGGQSFMRDLARQNLGSFREIGLADVK